jgi:hypothetical protein
VAVQRREQMVANERDATGQVATSVGQEVQRRLRREPRRDRHEFPSATIADPDRQQRDPESAYAASYPLL